MIVGVLCQYALSGGSAQLACLGSGQPTQPLGHLQAGLRHDDFSVRLQEQLDAFPVIV